MPYRFSSSIVLLFLLMGSVAFSQVDCCDYTQAACPHVVTFWGCDYPGGTCTDYVWDLKVVDQYLFEGNENSLVIIDISDPLFPVRLGSVETAKFFKMFIANGLLLGISNDHIQAVDISNPSVPVLVGEIEHNLDYDFMDNIHAAARGAYLYINTFEQGGELRCYSFSNPAAPYLANTLSIEALYCVEIVEDYLYTTRMKLDRTIHQLDTYSLADPAFPVLVSSQDYDPDGVDPFMGELICHAGYAYLFGGRVTGIWDLASPALPANLGVVEYDHILYPHGEFHTSGSVGYFEERDDVRMVDFSDPTNPRWLGALPFVAPIIAVGPQNLFTSGPYWGHVTLSRRQCSAGSHEADLAVDLSIDNATPFFGDAVIATVAVTNYGPLAASDIFLDLTVPGDFNFIGNASSQGFYNRYARFWNVGILEAGATATLDLFGSAGSGPTSYQMAAVVSSTSTTDSYANNDADSEVVTVHAPDCRVTSVTADPDIYMLADNPNLSIEIVNDREVSQNVTLSGTFRSSMGSWSLFESSHTVPAQGSIIVPRTELTIWEDASQKFDVLTTLTVEGDREYHARFNDVFKSTILTPAERQQIEEEIMACDDNQLACQAAMAGIIPYVGRGADEFGFVYGICQVAGYLDSGDYLGAGIVGISTTLTGLSLFLELFGDVGLWVGILPSAGAAAVTCFDYYLNGKTGGGMAYSVAELADKSIAVYDSTNYEYSHELIVQGPAAIRVDWQDQYTDHDTMGLKRTFVRRLADTNTEWAHIGMHPIEADSDTTPNPDSEVNLTVTAEADGAVTMAILHRAPSGEQSVMKYPAVYLMRGGMMTATVSDTEDEYLFQVDADGDGIADSMVAPVGLQPAPVCEPVWAGELPGDGSVADRVMDVVVQGEYAFVADKLYGLSIVDVSEPSAPVLAARFDTPGDARSVCLHGDLALVADRTAGLSIVDVSDPNAPIGVSQIAIPGDVRGVATRGDHAYLAAGSTGLQVVDLADPSNPVLVAGLSVGSEVTRLVVEGVFAYLAAKTAGLKIIDISNPGAPALVGSFDTNDVAYDVAISDGLAYIADGNAGMLVVDVSDPASPVLAGALDTPGLAQGVKLKYGKALIGDYTQGVQLVDIAAPAAMEIVWTLPTALALNLYATDTQIFVADFYGMVVADWNCSFGVTGLDEVPEVQHEQLEIYAHPNPFNPRTTITFRSATSGFVEVSLYDVRGREVRVLASGAMDAGTHELSWDGADASGRPVSAGVYFVQMKAGDAVVTRKIMMIK